jgi:hypothetical protein
MGMAAVASVTLREYGGKGDPGRPRLRGIDAKWAGPNGRHEARDDLRAKHGSARPARLIMAGHAWAAAAARGPARARPV